MSSAQKIKRLDHKTKHSVKKLLRKILDKVNMLIKVVMTKAFL